MSTVAIAETKFYRWLQALPSVPSAPPLPTDYNSKQKGLITLEYISPDREPINTKLISKKPVTKRTSISARSSVRSPQKERPKSPLRDVGITQRILEANKPIIKDIPTKRVSSKLKEEKCNVCFETNIKASEFLKCGHAVCLVCLPQLHKPICPVCQKPLAGITVTNDILTKIKRAEAEDKRIEEEANLAAAIAFQINPHAPNIYGNVYQRYH